MLVIWDFILAGLVFLLFLVLTWLVLWPHGESWLPDELRDDRAEAGWRSATPAGE